MKKFTTTTFVALTFAFVLIGINSNVKHNTVFAQCVTQPCVCNEAKNAGIQQAQKDKNECDASWRNWIDRLWGGSGNVCQGDYNNAVHQVMQDYDSCMGLQRYSE